MWPEYITKANLLVLNLFQASRGLVLWDVMIEYLST